MKKKILILYASYGSGHQKIAEYIAKYFKKQNDDLEIATLDLITYSMKKVGKWSQKANSFLMLKMPIIHDLFYRLSNNKISGFISDEGSMVLFKNKKMMERLSQFNPDITIATHFFGSSLIAYYNSKGITNSKLITVVTDYEAHELWINDYKEDNYIIVGNHDEEKQMLKKGIDKEKIKVFGIPIAPNETDKKNTIKLLDEYGFNNDNPTCIFFSGGGNGSSTAIPYIRKVITDNKNINFIIISGRNKKVFNYIDDYVNKRNLKNVKVLGYVNNVLELIDIADFVISKPGGVQSTECLYYNTPILMINASGGQEIANYKYFEKEGYGRYFRTPWTLNNFVKKISKNPNILISYKNHMKDNDSDKAMEKMYDLISKLL